MLENIDYVPVLANDGTKLMPTSPYRARKLLEKKKAKVYKCKPFSIMLTHDSAKNTQPIELCQDTGSNYIGMSVKSEKREFIHRPVFSFFLHSDSFHFPQESCGELRYCL